MGKRKEIIGMVVSNSMDKTVVVAVDRLVQHPKYNKIYKRRSKYKAHDEKNECKLGDRVKLVETRPISKEKRTIVKEILERAEG